MTSDDNGLASASTQVEHKPLPSGLRPWAPGQSGNPAGRKKGSRNKLTDDFVRKLSEDFEKDGAAAIEVCRLTEPAKYLSIIASLTPKDVRISAQPLAEWTDDDILDAIARIEGRRNSGAPALGHAATIEGEATRVVQAVPEADGVPRSG